MEVLKYVTFLCTHGTTHEPHTIQVNFTVLFSTYYQLTKQKSMAFLLVGRRPFIESNNSIFSSWILMIYALQWLLSQIETRNYMHTSTISLNYNEPQMNLSPIIWTPWPLNIGLDHKQSNWHRRREQSWRRTLTWVSFYSLWTCIRPTWISHGQRWYLLLYALAMQD